jgi:hypothetical protein
MSESWLSRVTNACEILGERILFQVFLLEIAIMCARTWMLAWQLFVLHIVCHIWMPQTGVRCAGAPVQGTEAATPRKHTSIPRILNKIASKACTNRSIKVTPAGVS